MRVYGPEKAEEFQVVFLAHAYLTLNVPLEGEVALRIIDEKFWAQMIETQKVPLSSWILPQSLGTNRSNMDEWYRFEGRQLRAMLVEALDEKELIHARFQACNMPIDADTFRNAANAATEESQSPNLSPNMSLKDQVHEWKSSTRLRFNARESR